MNVKRLCAAFFGTFLLSATAGASPHPLPFTYPVDTLGRGQTELELYNDATPLRVYRDGTDPLKGRLWEPQFVLQTEFEYGLSDKVEIAFYQQFKGEPEDGGGQHFAFDGFKWRVRMQLFDPEELPIDIGLYFELETLHDELALEEKLLLQKRFDKLRLMANLWVEQEIERPFDSAPPGEDDEKEIEFIVNPTVGATYEITPVFHLGGEYWARGQLAPEGDGVERVNHRVHHFIGPAIHMNWGSYWFTTGLYAHMNDMTKPTPGEVYGPFWFRMLLGINL